jgi:APA family basic amino acid/polyamine antiporter
VNNFLTGLKISILVVIIIISFCNFHWGSNFVPVIDKKTGVRGLIAATTKVFFAYVGFDFITTVSEETINPKKEVPRGILGTVILAATLYILTSFSVEGVGSLSVAIAKNGGHPDTALADVFSDHGMKWMSWVITIAALFGLTAVVLSNIMGQARVLRAFA